MVVAPGLVILYLLLAFGLNLARPGERPQPVAARAPRLSLRSRRGSFSACGGQEIDDPVDLVI